LGNRSDDKWLEIRQSATWRKEVAPSPNRANPAPLPPRPARSRPPMWNMWRRIHHQIRPTFIVWISLFIFLVLIFGGVFGIVVTRGSGVRNQSEDLALQVTPNNVAVGATVMLNGEHFKPYGKIGLTRDTAIPVLDTANATVIDADRNGNFADTIAITPDWDNGIHTLNAEDAFRHKVASFSIMVTGHTTTLRPAHLQISVDALDLGSGDQATNTTRTMTLANIGAGLISWQGTGSQLWLILSPTSGTIASGQSVQVIVAIDRSKLSPGEYKAQINILSTAGNNTVTVKAAVTQIVSSNRAILQTDAALLSFTAVDGGLSPSPQILTVSNPGLTSLQWQATTNTDWLFVSPQSGYVDPASNLPVTVRIDSSLLLPGTYNGAITLSMQGSDANRNNAQVVFVTVTIMPQCSLQVVPGQLNFTGVYQQGMPASKAINITVSQGCNMPVSWKAISNASWLTIATSSGQTPASPEVSVNISGLLPGVYNSSIMLSSPSGTQTLPVSFTLSQTSISLMTTAPNALSFSGVVGQNSSAIQRIAVVNTGGIGALHWTATATGGNWLAVYPATGLLMAHQSASFNVTASVLPALAPGTYKGVVTITGIDGYGHPTSGSPQVIPVSLLVQPACTFTISSGALKFTGISGQAALVSQQVALLVDVSCTHKLNWTATTSGGTWLLASVVGTTINVSTTLAHLNAGSYSGAVTVTAYDSVTGLLVGTSQVVPIVLTAQAACTLLSPSPAAEVFDSTAGSNPVAQIFTVSVTGTCSGAVTITPTIVPTSAASWLSVVTTPAGVASGGSATFTVTVNSAGLPAGQYQATLQLSSSNSGIIMSTQMVDVKLTVTVPSNPVIGTPIPTPTPTPMPSSIIVSSPTPTLVVATPGA
jgi:Viral BACON domain